MEPVSWEAIRRLGLSRLQLSMLRHIAACADKDVHPHAPELERTCDVDACEALVRAKLAVSRWCRKANRDGYRITPGGKKVVAFLEQHAEELDASPVPFEHPEGAAVHGYPLSPEAQELVRLTHEAVEHDLDSRVTWMWRCARAASRAQERHGRDMLAALHKAVRSAGGVSAFVGAYWAAARS